VRTAGVAAGLVKLTARSAPQAKSKTAVPASSRSGPRPARPVAGGDSRITRAHFYRNGDGHAGFWRRVSFSEPARKSEPGRPRAVPPLPRNHRPRPFRSPETNCRALEATADCAGRPPSEGRDHLGFRPARSQQPKNLPASGSHRHRARRHRARHTRARHTRARRRGPWRQGAGRREKTFSQWGAAGKTDCRNKHFSRPWPLARKSLVCLNQLVSFENRHGSRPAPVLPTPQPLLT